MRTRVTRPLLTAQEEIELARRVHGDDPADAIRARDDLVLANVGLVWHIVRYVAEHCSYIDRDDLFSEGVIALIRLAERFDPIAYQSRFASFAYKDVRGRLLNYVKANYAENQPVIEQLDPTPEPLERIVANEEIDTVLDALAELEPMRAYVVARRFALGQPVVRSRRQLAAELDVTYEYIRQLEGQALSRLTEISQRNNAI